MTLAGVRYPESRFPYWGAMWRVAWLSQVHIVYVHRILEQKDHQIGLTIGDVLPRIEGSSLLQIITWLPMVTAGKDTL